MKGRKMKTQCKSTEDDFSPKYSIEDKVFYYHYGRINQATVIGIWKGILDSKYYYNLSSPNSLAMLEESLYKDMGTLVESQSYKNAVSTYKNTVNKVFI